MGTCLLGTQTENPIPSVGHVDMLGILPRKAVGFLNTSWIFELESRYTTVPH